MPKKLAKSSQNQPKHNIANLFAVLTRLNPNQLMLLYGDLFTEAEAIKLAKRFEIACGLLAGHSYLQIQKSLGVTANTVAQIQKVLKNAGAGFRSASIFLTVVKESSLKSVRQETSAPLRKILSTAAAPKKKFLQTMFSKVFHSPVQ